MQKVTIRPVAVEDAEQVAALSAELGYPAQPDAVLQRLRMLENRDDHAVFVAVLPTNKVAGWIDVGLAFHMQSGIRAEIGGLVVTASVRGQGIGSQLLKSAEDWAAGKRASKVLLRSNIKRADAHRFYLREKYELIKTSAVFEKSL